MKDKKPPKTSRSVSRVAPIDSEERPAEAVVKELGSGYQPNAVGLCDATAIIERDRSETVLAALGYLRERWDDLWDCAGTHTSPQMVFDGAVADVIVRFRGNQSAGANEKDRNP
jgi:hypothetical protein